MYALVHVNTDVANPEEIANKVRDYPEVREIYLLFGEWDFVAMIEVDSAEALGPFVLEKVKTIPGVRSTSTQIVAKKLAK